MFALPEAWVWDFWTVDDGGKYHLFFLYASKALHDPDARHYRASIGHAVSDDLVVWTRVVDALVRSDGPAFDDLATWTGSVVRHPDGTWFMFYTGVTLVEGGNVQSIGYATSRDLMTWQKNSANPVLRADARWYERLADGTWHDEAFRDPWVYPDPDGEGWRMLVTARANHGPVDERGVIATAVSDDLRSWTLEPPLTEPGAGFAQLEVTLTTVIDDAEFLLFSCLGADLSEDRHAAGEQGGVWIMPIGRGPRRWDPREAQLLTDEDLYVGRIIAERSTGRSVFLAFRNIAPDGSFVGEIADARYVSLRGDTVVLGERLARAEGSALCSA